MGKIIDEYNTAKEYHAYVETIIDRLWAESVKYHMLQDEYETRLKTDMVAMLTKLQSEIEELEKPHCHNASHANGCVDKWRVEGIIQEKINALKGEYKAESEVNE